MKSCHRHSYLILIVAAGCLFSACQSDTATTSGGSATAATAAATADAGQLTIVRAPTLTEVLIVTIDGGKRNTVSVGDTFTTSLSPGAHVISALLEPNHLNLQPTKKTLEVKKGQKYTITAAWKGEILVLEP